MTNIANAVTTRHLAEALRALDEADVESERVLMALCGPLTDDDAQSYYRKLERQTIELRLRRDRETLSWDHVNRQEQAHIPEGTYYIYRVWRGWRRWRYVCMWERGDAYEVCPEEHCTGHAARDSCQRHRSLGVWVKPKTQPARESYRSGIIARNCCLLCGKEIKTAPFDPLAPERRNRREWIVVFRYRQPTLSGLAHSACANGKTAHDMTGQPDYSGFQSDLALRAYPSGYDAVQRGRERDALCRQQWLQQANVG